MWFSRVQVLLAAVCYGKDGELEESIANSLYIQGMVVSAAKTRGWGAAFA